MPNKLMFTWEPMAVEECMSTLQVMVECELVLTVMQDGSESVVMSGFMHLQVKMQVDAGGTCLVSCSLLLGIYVQSLIHCVPAVHTPEQSQSTILHIDRYLKYQSSELLCSVHSFCEIAWQRPVAQSNKVLCNVSHIERKLVITEVVFGNVLFLT